MLRSLYIMLIYVMFLSFGAAAPFVLSLGYVWVDTFEPQAVASIILSSIPVSLIMGVAALGSYAIFDNRKGRVCFISILLLIFAVWVTITTSFLAEVPGAAWYKWNFAFKTLCFAAFLPFVFRSRVHIEAFLLIYVFSMAVHFMPVGVKTLVSGGGYGRELGITSGNSLLAEGSTLSTVALMLVPIMLHLRAYGRLIPRMLATRIGYYGLATLAIAAAVGTYERTALVGMGVGGAGLWLKSKRKVLFGIVGAAAVLVTVNNASTAWSNRISTVQDYDTESSALGRILVWRWTMGYVSQHPLGGGFDVYRIDTVEFPNKTGTGAPLVVHGKAFHSVYFEVLGEQGFPGLAIFLTLIGTTFYQLFMVARRTRRRADLAWANDLAKTLQISFAILLSCGAAIGIAFQPMIYSVIAISACLHMHVKRVDEEAARERAPSYPPLDFDIAADALVLAPLSSSEF
jgi:putative inorganic carbon (HCO3(-)) transporter